MSVPGFMIRTLLYTPAVMIRFFPVFLAYVVVVSAMLLASSNIWVIGMVGFLMATFGTAFVYVNGIRAALQALRLTTAPTAEGIFNATLRMLFVYCLTQLIILSIFYVLMVLLFMHVLAPAMDPAMVPFFENLLPWVGAGDAPLDAEALAAHMSGGNLLFILFGLGYASLLGGVMALFGAPMAAICANAVQHTPGHDMLFGIGRYVPHQTLSYVLFVAVPYPFVMAFAVVGIVEFGIRDLSAVSIDAVLAFSGAVFNWSVIAGIVAVVLVFALFSLCLPWVGMALAYGAVRDRVIRERRAERVPEIDYEAERESVRNLRRARTVEKQHSGVYDPNAARVARSPED